MPGSLESQEIQSPKGEVPLTFKHELLKQKPIKTPGGSVRIVDSTNFYFQNNRGALVEVEPGGMRELHWHPNNDEWQYYLTGKRE